MLLESSPEAPGQAPGLAEQGCEGVKVLPSPEAPGQAPAATGCGEKSCVPVSKKARREIGSTGNSNELGVSAVLQKGSGGAECVSRERQRSTRGEGVEVWQKQGRSTRGEGVEVLQKQGGKHDRGEVLSRIARATPFLQRLFGNADAFEVLAATHRFLDKLFGFTGRAPDPVKAAVFLGLGIKFTVDRGVSVVWTEVAGKGAITEIRELEIRVINKIEKLGISMPRRAVA